ncbi:TspO/MBR family protein [Dongia sp.]|uniref:TspO/MBR family protein n=1 Tax=Dongia sp. TaxID=1977262 RepID=UPI0035B14E6A
MTPSERISKNHAIWVFLALIALNLLVSAVGGAITASSVNDWYAQLAKPSFNPPNWIFAPVWSLLYLMMAIAAWRIWRESGFRAARSALLLYGAQLAVNLLWSALFFGLQQPVIALVACLVLLALISATGWAFLRHDLVAAVLFLPYIAWVAFACLLNGAIVALS